MSLIVEVASVSDCDELVAEIWHDTDMVAELRRSGDRGVRIDIYANPSTKAWSFDLREWLSALAQAEQRLNA
jgi:hypothetical protein